MSTETEATVRPCCAMCLIVPDDPAAIEKRLKYVDYYLCTDRTACLDRATRQQHEARDAEDAVMRAVVTEKAALEAEAGEVKAAVQAGGPLKAIADAGVAEMTSAAKATEDTPEGDGEACHE